MVIRFVTDVARAILLREATYSVLEAGCPRDRPGAGQGFRIARVRLELTDIDRLRKLDRALFEPVDVRDLPRLRRIRDVAIGENDHRRHILDRHAKGFEGRMETVAGGRSGDDGDRTLGVPAV